MHNLQFIQIQDDLIELPPGTYLWCQCGRSENQPFCDGHQKQSCQNALEVTIHKPQTIALCRKTPEKVLEPVE